MGTSGPSVLHSSSQFPAIAVWSCEEKGEKSLRSKRGPPVMECSTTLPFHALTSQLQVIQTGGGGEVEEVGRDGGWGGTG